VPLIGAAAVRRALSALLLAVAGCSGCEADTLEIPWTYRFRDPALRATTVALTARVLRGGCGDEYPLQYREVFGLGETPPLPPRIGPGRWGFEVVATNAECAIVASGCTSTELPPDGDATRILVTVDVGSGAPTSASTALAHPSRTWTPARLRSTPAPTRRVPTEETNAEPASRRTRPVSASAPPAS
jgi:hypothetical protein